MPWLGLVLLASVLVLLPAVPAYADVGPKPSMVFRFTYEIPQVAITVAQQIECKEPTCSDGAPLEEIGPQRFWCEDSECRSTAYGYAYYHRLVITFADGVTRESTVFATQGRGGNFVVTVTRDALLVQTEEPLAWLFQSLRNAVGCLPGWSLTLVIETLIAGMLATALGMPRALVAVVPVASLVTLPVVWFVFPQLALPWVAIVGLSELFAVVFEGGIIYAFTHWTLPLRQVALLSLLMNGASFAVGLLLIAPG